MHPQRCIFFRFFVRLMEKRYLCRHEQRMWEIWKQWTSVGNQLTNDDLTEVMFQLSESSLPYFCDVSLFHNLNNPALKDHIQRRGRTIYEACAS